MARSRIKRRLIVVMVMVILLASASYARPLPALKAQSLPPKLPSTGQVTIPWPGYGQAAFGAIGYGVLATHGGQVSAPVASIAKIVTALSVLKQKPLAVGQQGPDITIGQADVDLYQKYLAEDGSVVPVNAGERISEYQALEAMLLPSANNIADSLAAWAYGSQDDYLDYANAFVKSLGLGQTHLSDASGFSPQTVSSAHDLVVLGERLLANPVLAQIVAQTQAVIPVAGTVDNVNWLLGTDGVVGIKTGNTDQAGGCFLFAAKRTIDGQQIEVVGAILNAPNRDEAISDSQPLIDSSDTNFGLVKAVSAGQAAGRFTGAWGGSYPAVAGRAVSVLAWNGKPPKLAVKLNPLKAPADAGKTVGSLVITSGGKDYSVPLVLQAKLPGPSVFWRIFHI